VWIGGRRQSARSVRDTVTKAIAKFPGHGKGAAARSIKKKRADLPNCGDDF
jgi:hypothetical protein